MLPPNFCGIGRESWKAEKANNKYPSLKIFELIVSLVLRPAKFFYCAA